MPDDAVFVEVSISADHAAGAEGFVRERVPDEIEAQVGSGFVPGGTRDGFGGGGRVVGGVRGEKFFQSL
jgi:hypothetical protein